MPRITVKIDPVGNVEIEGHEFQDASCKNKMKPIEDALGNISDVHDKPEASIPAMEQTGQHLQW